MTDGLSVSQTIGFMDEEGNGAGEEEVGLRSSSQTMPEGGLGTVIEPFSQNLKPLLLSQAHALI